MIDVLLSGRVVCGHPLRRSPIKKDNQPVIDQLTGQPKTETYFAVAVPKAGEQHWNQTEWGQKIYAQALADWPNGEHQRPTFAWKIEDGDSTIPNTANKKPCDREGWPGNWILHLKTTFHVECYNVGNYDPLHQITNEQEIKCGDYCRVFITVRGNRSTQTQGMYLNPSKFELSRAGEPIVSQSGPSASDVFGGGASPTAQQQFGQAVPATQVTEHAPAPQPQVGVAPPPPAPAPDFLSPDQQIKYIASDGKPYTKEVLINAGYTEAMINQLQKA